MGWECWNSLSAGNSPAGLTREAEASWGVAGVLPGYEGPRV